MTAIYRRELKAYFHSFIGCLFIGATLFLTGIYFTVYNLLMGYPLIGYALSAVVFLFMLSIPVLSMRVLAEERKQKTDQLILTAPVSVSSIVIGKYLALATIFVIPVAIIGLYPILLNLFGTVPLLQSYVALLGFLLYGLSSMAICVFISSLTESQVISAVLSFGILFIGYVMSGLCSIISQTGNLLTRILGAFDMAVPFNNMINGTLHLTSVIYYLTIIFLFLFFTVQSIQKRRYQVSSKTVSMSVYSSSVVMICTAAAVIINLIMMRIPVKYTEFDVTDNQLFSITDETKNIVSALQEDINIYVIANENQSDTTLSNTLKRYEALSSHIKVSYVDPAVNPKFFTNYTDTPVSSNSVIVESNKRSKVIDYYDIYQTEVDYNTYSSNVTGYDGEGQLTSAVAYVSSDDMPKIYAIEGHGELSLDNTFQNAVKKENIDFETIKLMDYEAIPDDAESIVLNAPTSDLSEADVQKLLSYLDKGGNLLLVSTYTGTEMPQLKKLFDYYQIEPSKGLIIETDQKYFYQNPFYLLPEISYDSITEAANAGGNYVFAPYSQGLTVNKSDEIEVTPLLTSSVTSFVRNDVESSTDYAKKEGDLDGPFEIGVKCIKTLNDNTSTAVIYSSESIFTKESDSMVSGTNLKLFTGTLSSLIHHTSSISIPVKSYDTSSLTVPQSTILLYGMLTILILPLAFFITGFIIWFKRRKK